ncbi:MAG: hypothetical protein GF398_19735 [Chitinivibrionales bacterium]|nr:hypothetical protein [Chitinivibrionales bacterium]
MRINHNLESKVSQNALFQVNRSMGKTLEKLSTGLRINRASDDAAGLGVSENLRTQVRGLNQAMKNTQDAISMLTIADGALQEQTEIVHRMRELVIQAKNDTYTSVERSYMGQEFTQLMEELDRIAASTNYNGMQIFATPESTEGSNLYTQGYVTGTSDTPHDLSRQHNVFDDPEDSVFGSSDWGSSHHFNMMLGANYYTSDANAYNGGNGTGDGPRESFDQNAPNMLTIQFGQMDSNTLFSLYGNGFTGDGSDTFDGFQFDAADAEDNIINLFYNNFFGRDATVQDKLELALEVIDGGNDVDPNIANMWAGANQRGVSGLQRLNTMRASIGATINRLEHTINNTMNQIQNTQAAESLIRDADFANEAAALTRDQILSNSATSILAQANMKPQSVLQLI